MSILLTGGAGYIGSHTAVELIEAGHEVIIVDNYYNSKPEIIKKMEAITGKKIEAYEIDCTDYEQLKVLFDKKKIEGVVHFAGYKAVGESVEKPLKYYENNINSAITVLKLMKEYNINKFVFSSSATVYGDAKTVPCDENMETGCTNPYGWTKYMIEQIVKDVAVSWPEFSGVLLRYFNPIGAHKSGLIGEKNNDIPNNLMPYITMVADGKLDKLKVFGNDYDTKDGTGIRDYIHVVDLAKGHVKAMEYAHSKKGIEVINLGTGTGYSVLEVIKTFEKANDIKINYEIVGRRQGDIAEIYADTKKAKKLLDWEAKESLMDMCKDAWRWEKNNF